jgi:hypothetical protein
MNTRAEHLIIFSLLAPFIFVITLMLHQWNSISVQMIEMNNSIEMIEKNMNTNDASLELNRVMWCGDVVGASMMELNRGVCGVGGDMSDVVDVSMMEPMSVLMCGRW